VSDHDLHRKTTQMNGNLKRYLNPAKPKFQQNVMIGAAHQIHQGTKDISAKETDLINRVVDNYESESGQHSATPNNSKPKRDISYIDIELD
jgi:hypothetical protein